MSLPSIRFMISLYQKFTDFANRIWTGIRHNFDASEREFGFLMLPFLKESLLETDMRISHQSAPERGGV